MSNLIHQAAQQLQRENIPEIMRLALGVVILDHAKKSDISTFSADAKGVGGSFHYDHEGYKYWVAVSLYRDQSGFPCMAFQFDKPWHASDISTRIELLQDPVAGRELIHQMSIG